MIMMLTMFSFFNVIIMKTEMLIMFQRSSNGLVHVPRYICTDNWYEPSIQVYKDI